MQLFKATEISISYIAEQNKSRRVAIGVLFSNSMGKVKNKQQ